MARLDILILKISLGIFAAVNLCTLIVTTDLRIFLALNVLVIFFCLGIFLFFESKAVGLARDYGISRKLARRIITDYFDHYKNVERISIDEYIERKSK